MPNPSHKTDCRRFLPERPCAPHKQSGAICGDCREYDPVQTRLLVLKVGALGDVVRTTAVLPAAKRKFPGSFLTWVARPDALPAFQGVDAVDRALPFSPETLQLLRQESFDAAWCLDMDPPVAAWMPDLTAAEKRGFIYSRGLLSGATSEAADWLATSLDDGLKRRNRRTYQEWVFAACGLPWDPSCKPQWTVTPEEKTWAQNTLGRLPAAARIIGLNTGAGRRWRQKRWTRAGQESFLRAAGKLPGVRVLLLGGAEEEAAHRALKRKFPRALAGGCRNSLRRFASLIDRCDVVVSGDTLALHIAVALGKKTVGIFGPTSAGEIELYGRGEKVSVGWDCLPCYNAECPRSPTCMEALPPADVVASVKRQLGI